MRMDGEGGVQVLVVTRHLLSMYMDQARLRFQIKSGTAIHAREWGCNFIALSLKDALSQSTSAQHPLLGVHPCTWWMTLFGDFPLPTLPLMKVAVSDCCSTCHSASTTMYTRESGSFRLFFCTLPIVNLLSSMCIDSHPIAWLYVGLSPNTKWVCKNRGFGKLCFVICRKQGSLTKRAKMKMAGCAPAKACFTKSGVFATQNQCRQANRLEGLGLKQVFVFHPAC